MTENNQRFYFKLSEHIKLSDYRWARSSNHSAHVKKIFCTFYQIVKKKSNFIIDAFIVLRIKLTIINKHTVKVYFNVM